MNKQQWRRLAPGALVSVVAPVIVFQLIRSSVDSDLIALAISTAVPVLWTLGRLAVTRKVDPVGVLGIAGFGVGIAVAWMSGGSPLALELRDAVPTGLLGLVCLGSLVVHRPLYQVGLRLLAKRQPGTTVPEVTTRTSTVITAVVGATLMIHAAVLTVLALDVPVGSYVGLSRLIGWPIIAAGVGLAMWYRRRITATTPATTS
jgi:hypothetical protein